MNVADRIGEMSVEFIALMRLAEDKTANCTNAATLALQLVKDINDLSLEVPLSDLKEFDRKVHRHTAWIANGPVAHA